MAKLCTAHDFYIHSSPGPSQSIGQYKNKTISRLASFDALVVLPILIALKIDMGVCYGF